jgi:hypothetical protein
VKRRRQRMHPMQTTTATGGSKKRSDRNETDFLLQNLSVVNPVPFCCTQTTGNF